MSGFDEREKGFERKFEHDQELLFKTKARRNRLLASWAARQLGISGAEAEAYMKEIVEIDLQRHGDDHVIEKLVKDFEAKGLKYDAARVRHELTRFTQEARKQLGIQS